MSKRTVLHQRMKDRGWSVVKTTMTIHDIPFKNNPEEIIPTEFELDEIRNGFNVWMEQQGKLL